MEFIGKCKLCGETKKLINSHIIPEGFYLALYDEDRRVYHSSASRNNFTYMQKGQRQYLLCEKCDSGLLGPYDKYGTEVIRDSKHMEKYIDEEKEIWINIDYNRFKIFLLSVLLRAHFADEFFEGVKLSNSEESLLKHYILNERAPSKDNFPILGVKLFDPNTEDDNCDEIITNGNTYEREDYYYSRLIVIIFGGYAWMYILPASESNDIHQNQFLNETGIFSIIKENIREFYPIQQIQQSINYSNSNFYRMRKNKLNK